MIAPVFPPFPKIPRGSIQPRTLGITLRPHEEAPLIYMPDREAGIRFEGFEATSPVLLLQVAVPERLLLAPWSFGGFEESYEKKLQHWEGKVEVEILRIQRSQLFMQLWDCLTQHPNPTTQAQYDKEAREEAIQRVGPAPTEPRWPVLYLKPGARVTFSLRNLVDAPNSVAIHTIEELGARSPR